MAQRLGTWLPRLVLLVALFSPLRASAREAPPAHVVGSSPPMGFIVLGVGFIAFDVVSTAANFSLWIGQSAAKGRASAAPWHRTGCIVGGLTLATGLIQVGTLTYAEGLEFGIIGAPLVITGAVNLGMGLAFGRDHARLAVSPWIGQTERGSAPGLRFDWRGARRTVVSPGSPR